MRSLTKNDLIAVAKKLSEKNLVAGFDGNLSCRTRKGMLITASGVYKGNLSKKDVVEIDFTGRVLRGQKKASSEFLLHAAVYEERPEIRAVIHAHPPLITTLSLMGFPLIPCLTAEAFLLLGLVPMVSYAPPGDKALSDGSRPFFLETNQQILSKHGALAYDTDLWSCLDKLEKMEMLALKIFHLLESGFPLEKAVFTKDQREVLTRKKAELGLRSITCSCKSDICELVQNWRRENGAEK